MFPVLPQPGHHESPRGDLGAVVRAMQIIRGALVMGAVSFGGVVAFLLLSGQAAQQPVIPNALFPNFPLLLLIAAPLAVSCVLASFVVPGVVEGQARRSLSPEGTSDAERDQRLLAAHQSGAMARGALLEGPSLFLLVTSLAEGHWWGLMWTGALQVLQLATFPTTSGVENWLRTQQELIELERIS
jgi:hypothetical protein